MKNPIYVALFLAVTVFVFACQKKEQPPSQMIIGATPTATPVIVEVTPTKIGVSNFFMGSALVEGEKCFEVKFVLRLQFSGDVAPLRRLELEKYFLACNPGADEDSPEIQEGRRIYDLIKDIDPAQVRVTMLGGTTTKVRFLGQTIGSESFRPETLWISDEQ